MKCYKFVQYKFSPEIELDLHIPIQFLVKTYIAQIFLQIQYCLLGECRTNGLIALLQLLRLVLVQWTVKRVKRGCISL